MSVAVFTGPSLPAASAAEALPAAVIEPPAGRGDLRRLYDEGARTFVLIDGVFAHRLAVSPGEIVALLRAGARVIGAASLGALRAVECAPAGMEGVGAVAALYRLGVIRDDDEVAVAVEPDRAHRASSVALVNVRFAALGALRRGLVDRERAGRLLGAARDMHFSERAWPAIFAAAELEPSAELLALCRATDIKRRDAELALARMSAGPAGPEPDPSPAVGELEHVALAPRYHGHDPLLGESAETLAPALARWLIGSGRYRRLDGLALDVSAAELWSRLERARELGPELMRLHAVRTAAALAPSSDGAPLGPCLDAVRAELAAAHGFAGWTELETGLRAHPRALAAARAAVQALALARRNAGMPASAR